MLAHRGKPTSAESPFNLSPAINSTPTKPRCRDIFAGSALLLQLQEQAVGVGQQQPASHQAEGDGGATEGATRDPHLEERLEEQRAAEARGQRSAHGPTPMQTEPRRK